MTKVSVLSVCPRDGGALVKDGENDGHQRFKCKACGWRGTAPIGREADENRGVDQKTTRRRRAAIKRAKGPQRYVITGAQNATPVYKPFFETLLAYCKARGAQLIVVPYRYKNPTAIWSKNAEHDDWWAPEVVPYLLDQRVELNPHLILLADVKTQPTAEKPLTGFETITGPQSAIIAHPRIAFKTVPTPQARMAKILTSTGACTEKNYIPSKAGKKAEHHHTFGACVVEVHGRCFHLRQINALKDGSFCELDHEYRGKTRTVKRAAALVMGDTHREFVDPTVVKATFGKGGIVDTLKPRELVWHDVHDFFARNHHHRGKVFINYAKHQAGRDNVEQDLRGTFDFVDRHSPAGTVNVFVPSNHPDALGRWVEEADPKTDPVNCVFWAQTFQAMLAGSQWTDNGPSTIDPFAYWGKQWLKSASRSVFLARGDSYMIRGIDCAHHGDKGANGAKGSRATFAKIGTKTVIGHGHAPGIEDGCVQVGTNSMLRLEYNSGLSGWMHTDCVIYDNGKRSLITIVDGEWRG